MVQLIKPVESFTPEEIAWIGGVMNFIGIDRQYLLVRRSSGAIADILHSRIGGRVSNGGRDHGPRSYRPLDGGEHRDRRCWRLTTPSDVRSLAKACWDHLTPEKQKQFRDAGLA